MSEYVEMAFLPSTKYLVSWSEERQGWVVYAEDDGAFS